MEKRYTYDEMLKHPSLKRMEGIYKRSRWPGIFSYTGAKGTKYGCDYYVGGKQRREMVGSLEEAKQRLAEIHAQVRKGEFVANRKKFTFSDLRTRYEEIHRNQRQFQHTRKYYMSIFQEFFGSMRLYAIGSFDLERFRKVRKEALTKHGKVRSDISTNRELQTLQHMFSKAVEWQMLEKNPFDRFKKKSSIFFREDKGRTRCLEPNQIETLLNVSPNYLRDIVAFDLLTGLRKGDLLRLRWPDVDLEKATLRFSEMKKMGRTQIKTLCSDAIDLLMKIPKGKDDYIFHGPHGEPIKDCQRSFRTALKKAGIKDFRFHDLRHTSASYLVMRGASMKAVQEHLGHSSLGMTEKYSHLTPDYLKLQVQKLNGLLSGEKPSDEILMRNSENAGATVNPEGYANA